MKVLLLTLVVVGALFVIASGIWVAVVLAGVVSSCRATPESDENAPNDD